MKIHKSVFQYRVITTQRGLCNLLFYDQMTRLGKIHNGYVKMNKHNQMMGFKWQGDLTINENASCNDIKITMDTYGYIGFGYYKKNKNINIMDNQYIHWHMVIALIIMTGRLLVNVRHKYMTY